MTTTDDTRTLRDLHNQREQNQQDIAAEVARLRADGRSWLTIGAALDITKQAAQQRFGQEIPS